MEIPSNWSSTKRQKPIRAKQEQLKKKPRVIYENNDAVTLQELCGTICQNLLDSRTSVLNENLNFDTILSSVPYKQILETIFGPNCIEDKNIPFVSKPIEESYMREPILPGERKCVMGNDCECRFIDKDHAFVGVEFLIGTQTIHNCEPQMCVLCSRKHTQRLFYDLIYKPSVFFYGTIQRYGVLINVENEYDPSYTLIMPPNGPIAAMPYPSPIHCRSNYQVIVRMAKRYIVQTTATNFCIPSLEHV